MRYMKNRWAPRVISSAAVQKVHSILRPTRSITDEVVAVNSHCCNQHWLDGGLFISAKCIRFYSIWFTIWNANKRVFIHLPVVLVTHHRRGVFNFLYTDQEISRRSVGANLCVKLWLISWLNQSFMLLALSGSPGGPNRRPTEKGQAIGAAIVTLPLLLRTSFGSLLTPSSKSDDL